MKIAKGFHNWPTNALTSHLQSQPYGYPDIGRAKAKVLTERLNTITREPVVTAVHKNA